MMTALKYHDVEVKLLIYSDEVDDGTNMRSDKH